jgi:hypothetical protein
VHQREEAELLAAPAGLAPALDRLEQIGDMGADRPLRMAAPRLAPGQALLQDRIRNQGPLEVSLGGEAADRAPLTQSMLSANQRSP